MTEATTSNSNRWLLAWTLRSGQQFAGLSRGLFAQAQCISRVLRAQRFKHTTRHEASPLSLGFLCHLSAPHPRSSLARFLRNVHNLTQDRRFRGATRLSRR